MGMQRFLHSHKMLVTEEIKEEVFMANYTKKVILSNFEQMLVEMPFDKNHSISAYCVYVNQAVRWETGDSAAFGSCLICSVSASEMEVIIVSTGNMQLLISLGVLLLIVIVSGTCCYGIRCWVFNQSWTRYFSNFRRALCDI